jgi:DNA-binding CsgD family transcriptional regulator
MAIGYYAEPKEIQFHAINYSNPDAVQGLLRNYFNLKADMDYKPNFELVCILCDLTNAIKLANLTVSQNKIMKLYMAGYIESEIAQRLNISQPAVSQHISRLCKRISRYLSK